MTRHIGIVAVSAEGAALCYRTICIEGAALLGRHAHPEVTTHTYPLADYMRHIDAGKWDEVGEMLLASAEKLRTAGAQPPIWPDNTSPQALRMGPAPSPMRWWHIADGVAIVADERSFNRLLVLGTRYLMESRVYPEKLSPKGIQHEIPGPEARDRINTLIFDELVYGRFEAPARSYFRH